MSDSRKACLDHMAKITGCEVVCVRKEDLSKYILPDHPLHPGYEFLSETQKGDYLKAYFMNFYGGGYADIKEQTGSWLPLFEALESSDKWICGYREIPGGVAQETPADAWPELIGNCAYISKPQTPLTQEWYRDMMKLMDERLDRLRQFPATFPQDHAEISRGKYPIEWNELNGRIFHRISYRYRDKLMNTLPTPLFQNYK
jgi:hypothetical protein